MRSFKGRARVWVHVRGWKSTAVTILMLPPPPYCYRGFAVCLPPSVGSGHISHLYYSLVEPIRAYQSLLESSVVRVVGLVRGLVEMALRDKAGN